MNGSGPAAAPLPLAGGTVAGGEPTAGRRTQLQRRARVWLGILSAYFGSQTLTQLLGIAAGILFVRYMPVGEFALYTLGSSVITFLAFTTDLGSTTSLVHFYRRAREEGEDFAGYLAAVLSLRRMAFAVAAVGVAVAFPLVATAEGFAALDVAVATMAVLVAVAFQIGASVRVLALRLDDRYGASYRAELAGAGLRLALALAMVAAALLQSWLGLGVAAAGSALTWWLAQSREAAAAAVPQPRHRAAILRYLLPTLPSALYFSLQGPLIVWLASTFGAARNIAEVGALGRLGLVVGIFGGLTGVVFVPRLARVADERLWLRRVVQFGFVNVAIGAALVGIAWLAPQPFLWVIGAQYSSLAAELLLVVTGAALTLVGGYLVAVNMSRGWVRWQSPAMLVLAASQAAMIAAMRLDTTAGLLTFNALSALVGLGLQVVILVAGNARPALVAAR